MRFIFEGIVKPELLLASMDTLTNLHNFHNDRNNINTRILDMKSDVKNFNSAVSDICKKINLEESNDYSKNFEKIKEMESDAKEAEEKTKARYKIFGEYLEIKNKILINAKLNLKEGIYSKRPKPDATSRYSNQKLKFLVKKTFIYMEAGDYWEPSKRRDLHFDYEIDFKCLALKRA